MPDCAVETGKIKTGLVVYYCDDYSSGLERIKYYDISSNRTYNVTVPPDATDMSLNSEYFGGSTQQLFEPLSSNYIAFYYENSTGGTHSAFFDMKANLLESMDLPGVKRHQD